MRKDLAYFTDLAENAIRSADFSGEPERLYDPISYTMALGGKRMRPALTLIGCHMFSGDAAPALEPAVGIELFHNFTLLHDDIMDQAPLRRGKPTVYTKWNTNTAILSGDTMFALASNYISRVPALNLPPVISLFNTAAIEVCEGQQMDMDFEGMPDVTEDQYIRMITLKTAALLAASLKIGAVIGGADLSEADRLYDFGLNIGIAFQLKDDLLDVFGESPEVGKISGGDILANKKTMLYIKAIMYGSHEQRQALLKWYGSMHEDAGAKIDAVKDIFIKSGSYGLSQESMNHYYEKALRLLEDIRAPYEGREILKDMADRIIQRTS